MAKALNITVDEKLTGVEETNIVESRLDDHSILVNVADLLQVSYKDLERRLKYLEFIKK